MSAMPGATTKVVSVLVAAALAAACTGQAPKERSTIPHSQPSRHSAASTPKPIKCHRVSTLDHRRIALKPIEMHTPIGAQWAYAGTFEQGTEFRVIAKTRCVQPGRKPRTVYKLPKDAHGLDPEPRYIDSLARTCREEPRHGPAARLLGEPLYLLPSKHAQRTHILEHPRNARREAVAVCPDGTAWVKVGYQGRVLDDLAYTVVWVRVHCSAAAQCDHAGRERP